MGEAVIPDLAKTKWRVCSEPLVRVQIHTAQLHTAQYVGSVEVVSSIARRVSLPVSSIFGLQAAVQEQVLAELLLL